MKWYALESGKKNDGSVDVWILDEIGFGGIYANEFISDVNELAEDGKELRVHINSPGGDVFQGLAIYNFLDRRANVTIIIEGIAASMASIVAMAGSNIIMPENALMMIHNPWAIRVGDAEELKKAAEVLDKMGESLAMIYAKQTGKDIDAIKDLMKAETWMNGAEAVEEGFATMTTGAVELAATFDIAKLANKVPKQMATAMAKKEKKMEELEKAKADLVEAKAKLDTQKEEHDAKVKESFNEGVKAGEEQALGNVKARMERYKNDEAFVVATIDLDDNQVKDKWIDKLEADNKAKSDALEKLGADDGEEATETKASGDDPTDKTKNTDTPKGRADARDARVAALKGEGKGAEEAWRIAHAEIPEPDEKED